jgi:hypothetical protein
MALKIDGHLFTGPRDLEGTVVRLNHRPVVFLILSKEGPPWDPVFRLIDVGCSGDEPLVFAKHEKRAEWLRRCAGKPCLYLLEMDDGAGYKDGDRAGIAETIRKRHAPPHDVINILQ